MQHAKSPMMTKGCEPHLCLVLGVALHRPELLAAMRKLAFAAIAAGTALLPRAAQLRLQQSDRKSR